MALRSEDKKAVAGVVLGLVAGAVYMTGPLAFPTVSAEVWQTFFWLTVVIGTLTGVYFILVHAVREDRAMPISLMVIGTLLFLAGSIWLGIVNDRAMRDREPKVRAPNASTKPNSELHPRVFDAQFTELRELEQFLSGKDEMGLRETFDIPSMLTRNIIILIDKIRFIRAGRWEDFQYDPYLEGHRDMIFWAKEGKFSTGPSGVHINAEPHDILILVTTTKHQDAKRKLTRFVNSAVLPDAIKSGAVQFDRNINKNFELMLHIMDERMHENEEYFLQYLNMGTPFYGVIASDYARHIQPLKPVADRLLALIAGHWRINV